MTNGGDRTQVRVTKDVGEIFGVDGEEYLLEEGEVVTLPTPNAEPLLDKDAAVRGETDASETDCSAALFMGGGGEDDPYEASHEEQEQRRRDAKKPEATGYARPASTLPVGQLDAMSPANAGGLPGSAGSIGRLPMRRAPASSTLSPRSCVKANAAQVAGRYARRPGDPESNATVFVRTDAAPPGFVDMRVPGVSWVYTNKQEAVIEALRDADDAVSARDLADRADVSKRHAHRTLKRLVEQGHVDAHFAGGDHGATLYSNVGIPPGGTADPGETMQITTDAVQGPYTRSVTISPPDLAAVDGGAGRRPGPADEGGEWDWRTVAAGSENGGDPPDN